MSYGETYPDEIDVRWCVMARVKGKGAPLTHVTIGNGIDATNAMIAWLEGVAVDGDACGRRDRGRPDQRGSAGGNENFRFSASGLGPAAIRYGQEWLEAVGPLDGVGRGKIAQPWSRPRPRSRS
jgi:hypothetical protein